MELTVDVVICDEGDNFESLFTQRRPQRRDLLFDGRQILDEIGVWIDVGIKNRSGISIQCSEQLTRGVGAVDVLLEMGKAWGAFRALGCLVTNPVPVLVDPSTQWSRDTYILVPFTRKIEQISWQNRDFRGGDALHTITTDHHDAVIDASVFDDVGEVRVDLPLDLFDLLLHAARIVDDKNDIDRPRRLG